MNNKRIKGIKALLMTAALLAGLMTITTAVRAAETKFVSEPLLTCDSFAGFWGTDTALVTSGAKEGSGYVKAKDAACPVICCNSFLLNDISQFTENGCVRFWYYVDHADHLKRINKDYGQFHLQTDGANVGYVWDMTAVPLQDGWNDVTLPFSEAFRKGSPTNVNTLWVWNYVTAETVIAVDGLRLEAEVDPEGTKVDISYVFEDGVKGSVPENARQEDKTVLTLPECGATLDGKVFGGYCDGFAVYPAGYQYRLNGDVSFTAVWYDSVDQIESVYDSAVRLATERSLIFGGSDEMRAAIANVLKKIENGEEVHVVTFGDSITAGAAAAPGNEWAAVVKRWLFSVNPSAPIRFYNAGIGSTEAVFGVSRAAKEVLSRAPDLIVVDSGGNNNGLPYAQEAYEGEITKFVSAGVPVVNFNCVFRAGINVQDNCNQVNVAYGVPQVSFRESYWALAQRKNLPDGLTADEIWSPDNVHPTDNGHKLCGDLVNAYLQEILDGLHAGTIAPAPLTVPLPDPVTRNGYRDAVLFESTASSGDAVTVESCDGWTGDYHAGIYQLNLHGWQTNRDGASVTYRVRGGYFAILMTMSRSSGYIDVSVDGGAPTKVTMARVSSETYMYPYNVIHLDDGKEHTVTVTLRNPSGVSESWFGICGIAAANLLSDVTSPASGSPDAYRDRFDFGVPNGSKSGTAAALTIVSRIEKVDASRYYPNGYLHIRIYTDDAAGISGGQVELSSSGTSDQKETSWNLSDLGLVNGWNELYLPIAAARAEGGDADFSALNYFRLFVLKAYGTNMEIKAEDVCLCLAEEKPAEPVTTEPESGETVPDTAAASGTEGGPVTGEKEPEKTSSIGWLLPTVAAAVIGALAAVFALKKKKSK